MPNSKKKILVVDDDPAILEVLSLILQDAGYEVKTTDNRSAEKLAGEYLPNVMLLDIWMAGMDGKHICRGLKNRKRTARIPIVFISASKDIEAIAKAAGADGFVMKPFEIGDIISIVKKLTTS